MTYLEIKQCENCKVNTNKYTQLNYQILCATCCLNKKVMVLEEKVAELERKISKK